MSTPSTRFTANPARPPAAGPIAARLAKQAAARADVDIRYLGAEKAITRRSRASPSGAVSGIARSTAIESYPYSSFEQGGVRRFERPPFTRGLFDGSGDLPPFRVY